MARIAHDQVDTELSRLRAERLARYRADPVTDSVRWISVGDGRSEPACEAMHDQVVRLDDAQWPQLLKNHGSCRCRFTWAFDAGN